MNLQNCLRPRAFEGSSSHIYDGLLYELLTDNVNVVEFNANNIRSLEPMTKFNKLLFDGYTRFEELNDGEKDIQSSGTIILYSDSIALKLYTSKKYFSFTVSGTDKAETSSVFQMVMKALSIPDTEAKKATIKVLAHTHSAGYFTRDLVVEEDPVIRENYSPSVMEKFDHCVGVFKNPKASSKLIILDGPPGTGKTHLVRGFVNAMADMDFIVIPPRLVSRLGDPDLIDFFASEKEDNPELGTCFIIEDADECLMKRGTDNLEALSSLLNMTDGLIGHALDMKIICTTNAKLTEIDPAVTRKGRLAGRIQVDKINAEQANAVYERLTGGKVMKTPLFTTSVTLADIYGLVNEGLALETTKANVVGF